MDKTEKVYRLHPRKPQQESLASHFNYAQRVWNIFLAEAEKQYSLDETLPSILDMQGRIPEVRKEHPFLHSACSTSIAYVVRQIAKEFTRLRNGKTTKMPPPKNASYRTVGYPNGAYFKGDRVYLPKIGMVKFTGDTNTGHDGNTVVVTCGEDGRYWVSFRSVVDIVAYERQKAAKRKGRREFRPVPRRSTAAANPTVVLDGLPDLEDVYPDLDLDEDEQSVEPEAPPIAIDKGLQMRLLSQAAKLQIQIASAKAALQQIESAFSQYDADVNQLMQQ